VPDANPSQLAALLHARIHLRLEKPVHPAAVALGAIQRHIRVLQKLVGVGCIERRDGNADADVNDDPMAVEVIGLRHGVPHAAGERRRIRRLAHRRHDDGEFVAAQPCNRVGLPGAVTQPVGNHLEQLVADRMPERIVDALEMIEIEAEHGERFSPLHPLELVLQPLTQQHAIGQVGQRVVTRHMRDLLLGAPSLGDVLVRCQPAAARHGLVHDRNDPAVGEVHGVIGSLSPCNLPQQLGDVFIGIAGEHAGRQAQIEQRTKADPRTCRFRRQAVNLGITSIAEDQSRIGTEHQHSLRHVVENPVEQVLLIVCRGLARAGPRREPPDRRCSRSGV
jgi:hypothetical protein